MATEPETRLAGGLPPVVERWTTAAETGCRRCRRCRGRIVWGQIDDDTGDPKAKGRWVKLDPDLMPHGCQSSRAGRVVVQEVDKGDASIDFGCNIVAGVTSPHPGQDWRLSNDGDA